MIKQNSRVSSAVKKRRRRWLGHILRMNEARLVRRALLATSQQRPPFNPSSLWAKLDLPIAECLANFAAEPYQFRAEWVQRETRLFPIWDIPQCYAMLWYYCKKRIPYIGFLLSNIIAPYRSPIWQLHADQPIKASRAHTSFCCFVISSKLNIH